MQKPRRSSRAAAPLSTSTACARPRRAAVRSTTAHVKCECGGSSDHPPPEREYGFRGEVSDGAHSDVGERRVPRLRSIEVHHHFVADADALRDDEAWEWLAPAPRNDGRPQRDVQHDAREWFVTA